METRHRFFGYLLLLRRPLPGELEEIDAAYGWMRRNAVWLAGAYAAILYFTIWPAFGAPHDLPYRAVAVVATHFLLWAIATSIAACLVGFRAWGFRACVEGASSIRGALPAIVWTTLLFVFLFALFADPDWERAFRRWLADTFGSIWWYLGVLAILVYGVPDLVARLRRRELTAVTRALTAEASSERLARKTAESELRLLQAQVEPHFLYNTLANLRYLIQKDSPDALRMTDALIEYLRTSVPDMRALRVTLGRETDHARHYLEIMRMRMGDRLAFSVDVPETLRAVEVPPLMLLTLVENAVKHGIAPRVEGGEVVLRARDAGVSIEIEVSDTGIGVPAAGMRSSETPSTGVGLENLRGRLHLSYGEQVAVELLPNVPRGTRVLLRLPREMPVGEADERAQVRILTADAARSAGLLAQEAQGGNR